MRCINFSEQHQREACHAICGNRPYWRRNMPHLSKVVLLCRSPPILASADSTLLERVAVLRNGGLSQDEVIKVLTVHPQVCDGPFLPLSYTLQVFLYL